MTLDLSAITDSLIDLVKNSWITAPLWAELDAGSPPSPTPTFTPNFSGLAPDVLPKESGPQLSLFLYHVEANNAMESRFWQPQALLSTVGPGEPVRFLPMALDLYYLMSAYSASSYQQEQQAMSVALRIFHATPIVHGFLPVPWELTLTMEHRSYDEMSRLWQATTSPMRLSVVYRAAVVFIDPDTMPTGAPITTGMNVIVEPLPPGPRAGVELYGTFRRATYTGPASETVSFTQAPATVAPGQQVWLMGSNLASAGIHLLSEGGTETDISAWIVAADSTTTRVVLQLPPNPGAPGAPGAAAPDPGVYQVRVGTELAPLSVAAFVDPLPQPVLPGTSITMAGLGFVPGATEILVGAAQVPSGQVMVAPTGTSVSFTFSPPAEPAGTVLPIRVLVAGIESDPAHWVTL